MREPDSVPKELLASCRFDSASRGYALPSRADLKGGIWVVAATCATAQRLLRLDPADMARRGKGKAGRKADLDGSGGGFEPAAYAFSHVIVDEAGQASEPECLCSISGALARHTRPGNGPHPPMLVHRRRTLLLANVFLLLKRYVLLEICVFCVC